MRRPPSFSHLTSILQSVPNHNPSSPHQPSFKIALPCCDQRVVIRILQSMCESQNLSFDLSIYLVDHQGDYLFTKGFIDHTLHLARQPSPECEFRLEQKSYLMRSHEQHHTKNQEVVFGTEILIKHIFSNFYLCIEVGEDGNETLRLRPECNENCYFEILPQRTFEHKGDFVNFDSFFVIRHSITKCYLGNNLLETGTMRSKMQRQLKSSKIKQSYKISDRNENENQLRMEVDPNKTFCLEMRNNIESQWDIRQQLADELRKTEGKLLVDPLLLPSLQSLKQNQPKEEVFLPLKTGKYSGKEIRDCAIEKHIHTMWRATKLGKISHPFLENNDYVYFISSNKNRGLMNITSKRDRARGSFDGEAEEESIIEFIKNQGENQYICSAIFIVEIIDRDSFYLKHMLTGKYFPFNRENKKKPLKLKPLLPFNSLQNKLPPFHLLFENSFYPPKIADDASTCGFWLNKANKLEINEILSLEGAPSNHWIPYLLRYLDTNRRRRQEILQQFKLIRFLIEKLIHSSQQTEEVYQLLFKMINNYQSGRKEATEYLSSNILQSNKFYIIDILSEIFDNDLGYVEKYINPEQLGYILNDFILEDSYSVIYMRIFRLFCGHHTQPCQRNQNLIFNFFFHFEHLKKRSLTESVYALRKQVDIPEKFKFCIRKEKGVIVFQNNEVSKPFNELSQQMQDYIRQFYYLLGDCIKLNKENIEAFRSKLHHIYSLEILLEILETDELSRLKGPILQLVNAIYLEPEYRYKLYVFINDYESMCYNGGLISLQGDEKITRLLNYINQEVTSIKQVCDGIEEKRNILKGRNSHLQEIKEALAQEEDTAKIQFKSTQFKHLLLMIKFSIENAYWKSEDAVLNIVDIIGRFYSNKTSVEMEESHSNYGQISEWNNYMESTIICIDIATLFVDIKINLAISHLINLPDKQRVEDVEIAACARKIESNQEIRKYFTQFQACHHQNSKLIKKSLILSRKFYQLRSIIKENYQQAMNERVEARNMKDIIEIMKNTLHHIKLSNKTSLETCQLYITQCIPGIRIEDLHPFEMLRQSYTLNAICKYRQPSHEFQVLAYRLGVLELLKEDLYRYVNLRGKEKPQEQSHIYWKMILVYVLIKDNRELRREVSSWRRWLIALVREDEQRDGQIGILVIDVLEQIYRNSRSLIVSDSDELLVVCGEFVRLIGKDNGNYLGSNSQLNTKLNKIIHLLGVFLTVEGRKIKNNFQLVVNEIFEKENIVKCIIKMRNIDNFEHQKNSFTHEDQNSQIHNNVLFKLLLYLLTDTLEQKPEKIGFLLPDLSHLLNLILAVGRNNWNLTFRIYDAIQSVKLDNDIFMLVKVFRANLNTGVELIYDEIKSLGKKEAILFNNPEIKALLSHFSVMIKIAKLIFSGNVKEKQGLHASSTNQGQLKLEIAEKLCLISEFVSVPLRKRLLETIKDFEKQLSVPQDLLQKIALLRMRNFTLEQIKFSKRNLLELIKNQQPQPEQEKNGNQKPGIQKQGNVQQRIKAQQNALSTKFCIDEVRQFIKSLIYINKSDASILDTDLKTFFISFLTSTFPPASSNIEEGDVALNEHQGLMIEYGTAELITTIIQQKYRENRCLFINLFELANKLLQNGSEVSQRTFLQIFKRDHKNVIFQNITTIIESSLIGIRFYYQQEDGNEYSERNEAATREERRQVSDVLKRSFRFLQLLCENDNQDLKKYIYSQTNETGVVKYLSINFIEIAIYFLLQLATFSQRQLEISTFSCSEIEQNLLQTILYILDFLIQVCQYPALKNQICLCNSDFFNIFKRIISISRLPKAQDKAISKSLFAIERKIVLLVRGLLQERNDEIINTISKKINEDHLKFLIDSSLNSIGVTSTESLNKLKNHFDKAEDKVIDQIQNVVDVLIISKVLSFAVQRLFNPEFQSVLSQIDKKIRQIQVDFKGQLTKIYFCYLPIFDQLSQNTRQFFINRSLMLQSRNQKLRELINSRSIINQDIINRKSRKLIISENVIKYLFYFSILLCFILLFLQIFFFSVNASGIALDSLEQSIIYNLAKMQFLTAGIYFSLWGINISSVTKQKMRTRLKMEIGVKKSRIRYYYMLLKEIYLQENTSLHATLLFSLSLIACWIDVRLYSFVLLYIFAKIETLSNILTAIRLSWGTLLVVSLLAMAFTFVFGLLSINNYVKVLYDNQSVDVDIGHIQSHCTTVYGCIDSLLTQRIIGETPSREGQKSHYGRFIADTIHWSFFDILFTNIVAAIIIDKFAELRNLKEKVENEQKNRCFICSAEKSSIQRKNEDFQQHVNKKHCLWDYFYYLYYLEKLKSYTEYTGIEYWIVRQVKEKKIDWFPNDDALKEDDDQKKLNSLFDLFVQKFNKQPIREGKQEQPI